MGTIDQIIPGKTYPACVEINEIADGKPLKVKFLLQSYFVGMYCAIHINDETIPMQTGDHDNKKFVRGLKRDIAKAIKRGAQVEIGAIRNVKTDMD